MLFSEKQKKGCSKTIFESNCTKYFPEPTKISPKTVEIKLFSEITFFSFVKELFCCSPLKLLFLYNSLEIDSVLLIYFDNLNLNIVAHLDDIFNLFNTLFIKL